MDPHGKVVIITGASRGIGAAAARVFTHAAAQVALAARSVDALEHLGRGREQRRLSPRSVPPEVVAHTLLRAAWHEPREAYVTTFDRLMVLCALTFPDFIERILMRTFRWEAR